MVYSVLFQCVTHKGRFILVCCARMLDIALLFSRGGLGQFFFSTGVPYSINKWFSYPQSPFCHLPTWKRSGDIYAFAECLICSLPSSVQTWHPTWLSFRLSKSVRGADKLQNLSRYGPGLAITLSWSNALARLLARRSSLRLEAML